MSERRPRSYPELLQRIEHVRASLATPPVRAKHKARVAIGAIACAAIALAVGWPRSHASEVPPHVPQGAEVPSDRDDAMPLREDGSLLIDGMYPVDEFLELFDLATLPGYDKGLFQSLGGFVMNYLGRIPSPGDHFEWQDMRFEVVDMDSLRIDKILVEKSVSDGPAQDS